MTKRVLICHGIFSNWKSMAPLGHALRSPRSGIEVECHEYEWRKDSVLSSGIRLAEKILVDGASYTEDFVLVGHSQGGLVCRVAAAALVDSAGLANGIQKLKFTGDRDYRGDALRLLHRVEELSKRSRTRLLGVAMLATPNSGAITNGQLSMLGQLLSSGLGWISDRSTVAKTLPELTTDRLFRVLQYTNVTEVSYLSVSGSYESRFRAAAPLTPAYLPLVRRLGIHLQLPNDGIVEDASVDLRCAALRHEQEHVAPHSSAFAKTCNYEHVRMYLNCVDVDHSSIHEDPTVHGILKRWIAAL